MTDTETALERVKIKQSRGPTLEFDGQLLCATEWDARDSQMRLELYQTKGGVLVPVTISTPHDEGGREITSAAVVEPIAMTKPRDMGETLGMALAKENPDVDHDAMRFAVLDFWDWTDRARAMVRKDLKWALKRVVD